MVQTIDFQPDEAKSETVKLEYINPFALMSWLAKIGLAFSRFMKSLLLHCIGNLVIYCDDVTPGNRDRSDHGRTFTVF